jgi:succinate dehydrogenase/fumarate reductase flavoprotein subunit
MMTEEDMPSEAWQEKYAERMEETYGPVRANEELQDRVTELAAQLAAMQRERDEARDERDVMYDTYRIERDRLAAAKLDARTAYARGLKDAAQAFEVRRAEIMAHADAELAKLGVKQG